MTHRHVTAYVVISLPRFGTPSRENDNNNNIMALLYPVLVQTVPETP